MTSLDDLFLHELKDLYSAETQMIKALPKMAKNASSPELKRSFEEHLEQTREHVERLKQIFHKLDETPGRQKCKGMEGLIEEGADLMEEDIDGDVLDAGLIGAAQRVEHYEISAYGTARAFAEQLGNAYAAKLLQRTLDEEATTNEKLTRLAESLVNREAVNA
ncbi:MAG: ferritin-like domain-containing protein [Vicinamibacterales bacterium]